MKSIDADGSGVIDYTEFLAAWLMDDLFPDSVHLNL